MIICRWHVYGLLCVGFVLGSNTIVCPTPLIKPPDNCGIVSDNQLFDYHLLVPHVHLDLREVQ